MKKIVFIAIFALNFALAQTLKVGTNVNYEPFEYLNMSFEIVGFDIDMIEEISKRAGFKYELVNMEFNELIPALTAKR